MYPRMEISKSKLRHNTKVLCDLCRKSGINVMAVTKCFCAIPEAAAAFVEGGAEMLADSRIENLKKLKSFPVKKVLLRIPMYCEVDDVVEYADYSLNSELSTLIKLGEAAVKKGKIHNAIIMVDLGDLREGIWPNHIDSFVEKAVKIKGIEIKGFGVNLTCYGGVIPDEKNLKQLVDISNKMAEKYGLNIEIISGGNSSSVYLLLDGKLPEGINNLRLGEVLLLGRETAYGNQIKDLYRDAFILKGQIVELKDKPSVPIGNIGMDAFGRTPEYKDRGIMKRAIVAIGRQDIVPDLIHPVDEKLEIIGASSDHLIINATTSENNYKVGDVVEFLMDYGGLLSASTSPYIEKIVIE